MRVTRTIRFCISRFYPPCRNQNLPQKQSQNPLCLREIQEFYRISKAKFYPLTRNLKFHSRHEILKFPQKIKPLIRKFKIPPIYKASRLIRHATKIKFLNSTCSAYLANK